MIYYLREYHLSPGERFVERCQEKKFQMAMLAEDEISQIISYVFGSLVDDYSDD